MRGTFMPMADGQAAIRDWFHRLINAREDAATLAAAGEWLEQELAASPIDIAGGFDPYSGAAAAIDGAGKVPDDSPEPADVAGPLADNGGLLAFHAPLALLEGAWLQSLALAVNGHRPEVAGLFAAYLALLGKDEAASPAFCYRGQLVRAGVCLPEAAAWRFAHDARVGCPALQFSSLQLTLGWHAATHFGETLGFTVAYLRSTSPWRLPCLPNGRRQAVFEAMQKGVESALRAGLTDAEPGKGVRRGYALYRRAEHDYLAQLADFALNRGQSPGQRVAEMFRRKVRFGRGYHGGVRLGDRLLEEWFRQVPFDVQGFLAAFAASEYARGARGQRPLDRMSAFGGPMFGVFDDDELAAIDAWLDEEHRASKNSREPTPSVVHPPLQPPHTALPARSAEDTGTGLRTSAGGGDCRNLFHWLVNGDLRPDTFAAARCRVEKVLCRAARALATGTKGPGGFFEYSPQGFADRVAAIHEAEVARYQPFRPPPRLSREEYVWGIRQFAPAVLVDGCWLQHCGQAVDQDKRAVRLLYRIYAEELGEGSIDWNHPKIYRDLLAGLGIDLPSAESREFAQHPGFLDAAFDLPVYLLAISRFPARYFAEILGLNLAIEMSGLGAGYMRLAEELRWWHIDPLIVTLHLSIDNLAGGHAAMAAEAIQHHLDEIRRIAGDDAMRQTWRRIWSGYLSLNAATRRFKWALMLGFFREFGLDRLRSRFAMA